MCAVDRRLAVRHSMQGNKSKDTKPELVVRRALREAGYPGYRLHWKKCAGRPDICYPGRKLAIFVNGCFWHRCPHCDLSMPRSNVEFWENKFARNLARDERNTAQLVMDGWTVVIVWECALKKARRDATLRRVVREVELASLGVQPRGRLVDVGYAPGWHHAVVWKRRRR